MIVKFVPFNMENSHQLCDVKRHPILSLMESQWKQHETTTSEFPNGGKTIVEQILVSEEINQTEQK